MRLTKKVRYAALAELGCIVCYNLSGLFTPTCIHHIRHGQGMSQRSHFSDTLPLCHMHHQGGACGVALHAGQSTWEKNFGTETELLEQVNTLIGDEDD